MVFNGRSAQAGALTGKIFGLFLAHCESCAHDVENTVLVIRVCFVVVFERLKHYTAALCIFFLIIVKSLQLHRHRQITEPRKYYLVRVIVFFLWRVFSLFFVSHKLEISG